MPPKPKNPARKAGSRFLLPECAQQHFDRDSPLVGCPHCELALRDSELSMSRELLNGARWRIASLEWALAAIVRHERVDGLGARRFADAVLKTPSEVLPPVELLALLEPKIG